MLKQLKSLTIKIIAAANVVAIAIMALSGYSDHLHPMDHPILSVAGLAFPITLLVNAAFLVFWTVFKWRMLPLPIVGFAIVLPPLRVYVPLNSPAEPPAGAIKVLSYNVRGYRDAANEYCFDQYFDYIDKAHADIVCLQEAYGYRPREIVRYDSAFAYRDTVCKTPGESNVLAIYSRFPVLRKEKLEYPSQGNVSAAFYLQVGRDTVIVINNHLESSHLSPLERQRYKTLLKGEMAKDTARAESKRIIQKLAEQTQKRSVQADVVAQYIADHSQYPIIVCGDFNDSPISYARRAIATGLTDCFVETGRGLGLSFNQKGFYFRIDNIMCSPHFTPYQCQVDAKTPLSDHYPIYCWLKKRQLD